MVTGQIWYLLDQTGNPLIRFIVWNQPEPDHITQLIYLSKNFIFRIGIF
tara:strand:- start:4092 stop:4238 length:147 start_codon:yes stop_codon:yes gene_type:complete